MRSDNRKMFGVVTAGLVVALGCMAPAGVAMGREADDAGLSAEGQAEHTATVIEAQASDTVYVNPGASGEPNTYASVEVALWAVPDGGTIALKNDVTLEGMATVDKDVTLDLGGYTVTGCLQPGCFWVAENHTLTIDGGGTIKSVHEHVIMAFGTLVAKNCTLAGTSGDSAPVWLRDSNAKAVIDGATITADAGPAAYILEGATLEVKSGSLSSGESEVIQVEQGSVSVSGGTLSSPVHLEWCAEGFAPRMVAPNDESAGYTVGRSISRPNATNRVYNGAEQYGVDSTESLLLSGTGVHVGTYKTTVTPADGYAWEPETASDSTDEKARSQAGSAPLELDWRITPKQLESSMVSASDQTYDATPKTPVVVKDGSTTLVEGTVYNVAYKDNTNAGKASYTVTGAGDYMGNLVGSFQIAPANIADATFSSIEDQTYTGKEIEPEVLATYANKALAEGEDYELAYANNTNVGTATITVRGKGNFTGEKTIDFSIVEEEGSEDPPDDNKNNTTSSSDNSKTTTSKSSSSKNAASSSNGNNNSLSVASKTASATTATSQKSVTSLPRTSDETLFDSVSYALLSGIISLVAGFRGKRTKHSE